MGNRTVALRPEFTSSIARLATTALKNEPKPLRTLSVGSVYRYDEPQRGRYREFYQSDFEIIGTSNPEADAEIILLTDRLMKSVGLRNYAFKLGHVGVIRGILSQENVDEKTQNAILQRMDKKEFDEAFKLITSEECLSTLRGSLELKTDDVFETVERIESHVEGYCKAAESAKELKKLLETRHGRRMPSPVGGARVRQRLRVLHGHDFRGLHPRAWTSRWAAAEDTTSSSNSSAANPHPPRAWRMGWTGLFWRCRCRNLAPTENEEETSGSHSR